MSKNALSFSAGKVGKMIQIRIGPKR